MTDPFANVVTAAQAAQTAAITLEGQLTNANAEVGTLQGQVTSLTATNASLGAQNTALTSQNAALASQNALLLAELNSLETTSFGMNATSAAQKATADKLLGASNITALRTYREAGQALTYPASYALAPGQFFVYSGKVLPQNLTVATLVALFRSVPAGVKFYYCVWHEPEDNIAAGQFTAAQLRAAWAVARQAQQQVGNPNILLTPILMGYSWQPGSHRNPEDYLPDDANWDVLGADTYFAGSIGAPASAIPTGFDAAIATATAHGKRWAVPETGVGQKVTGAARNAALTLLAQTAKHKGAAFLTYFVGTTNSNEWKLSTTDGSAAALVAGQTS